MTDPGAKINVFMGKFQQELVRWNRQINLVSRKDTLGLVAALIAQCRASWQLLLEGELATWAPTGPISYFDLGSGGGLPGFVWHQLLVSHFGPPASYLVEPREKRAWFLERLNAIQPQNPFAVLRGRWGEVGPVPAGPPGNVLISLKALHLSDFEVLAGLAASVSPASGPGDGRLVIARFYPPSQKWTPALTTELAPLGGPTRFGGAIYTADRQHVLSPGAVPGAAALVVSTYTIEFG